MLWRHSGESRARSEALALSNNSMVSGCRIKSGMTADGLFTGLSSFDIPDFFPYLGKG